jgi:hypothetical protein
MPTLTVFFDDPWWVGVIEVADGPASRVYRWVFGAEPSGPEVQQFVLGQFGALIAQPGAPLDTALPPRRANPKRAAREVARAVAEQGVSSKAQEALRLQIEAGKQERRRSAHDRRQERAAAHREQAEAKAKEKRRGH